VALVDNDGYVNDGSSPSDDAALAVYQTLMTDFGFHGYDTLTIDSSGDQSWNVSNSVVALPTPAQLAQYTTLIWFTSDNELSGAQTDEPLSADQETNLTGWLDLGGKRLVIISEYLIGQELGGQGTWTGPFTDPLFTGYLPLAGGVENPYSCPGPTSCTPLAAPFGVAGSSIVSSVFGMSAYEVAAATAPLLSHNGITATALNPPATGTDTVATIDASPQSSGLANSALAVAVGARNVGLKGTSTVVYVGFPPEAIVAGSAGSGLGNGEELFTGVLTYAGIVP
jgi:hypothetical protein